MRIGLLAGVLAGATVHWSRFSSTFYPYTLSQPSSFRHVAVVDSGGHRVDYFFPVLLGSFPTNVNVAAVRGSAPDTQTYLRSIDGHDIHEDGTLTIMGHRRHLWLANFQGLAGSWTEEQVSFTGGGYTWRLTASFERRYRSWRGMMLRVLSSFQLKS